MILDRFIHPDQRQNLSDQGVHELRNFRVAVGFCLFAGGLSLLCGLLGLLTPAQDLFDYRLSFITVALCALALASVRPLRTYYAAVALVVGVGALVILPMRIFADGGFSGPNMLWYLVFPLFAGANMPVKWARIVSVSTIVFVGGMYSLEGMGLFEIGQQVQNPKQVLTFGLLVVFIQATFEIFHANQKRKVEELDEERQRVFQSSRLASLGEMAGGIAHEVNNPLAIAIGYAEILESSTDEGLPKERRVAAVQKVRGALDRVKATIDTVRKLSRDAELDQPEPINIGELVESVQSMTSRITTSIGPIEYEVDESSSIIARESEIVQVLINLLVNGADAVADVSGPKIMMRTALTPAGVLFEVLDNGPGVPAELEKRIMEPFFTTKPLGHGTGLGLSLANLILGRHQSHLEYSRRQDWTVFHFTLPREARESIEHQATHAL